MNDKIYLTENRRERGGKTQFYSINTHYISLTLWGSSMDELYSMFSWLVCDEVHCLILNPMFLFYKRAEYKPTLHFIFNMDICRISYFNKLIRILHQYSAMNKF